ncbi:MAG: hypothetical protein K0R65_1730 [Crocinitomicaceae bacterium]|jgi:hypothetical protein|nr:hypothetical protein [Crocinitomicaceae bacterium]
MIRTLRLEEEIILHENLLNILPEDEEQTLAFLELEYQNESLSWPHTVPAFNPQAALWAARYLYTAAQVILFRKALAPETETFLKTPGPEINPGTILSVDLCFRFMPDIMEQLHVIDSEDPLLPVFEEQLRQWHYSGMRYELENDKLEMQVYLDDPCLRQLYCERVVRNKNIRLAQKAEIQTLIRSYMGMYETFYWKEFNLIASHE